MVGHHGSRDVRQLGHLVSAIGKQREREMLSSLPSSAFSLFVQEPGMVLSTFRGCLPTSVSI